jgi:hypothetical protein
MNPDGPAAELLRPERDGVVLRAYEAGDEDAINAAFNHVFGLDRSLDDWRWKFRAEPRAIAVATVDGEVVAHAAGLPARLQVGGRVSRVLQVVDTFSLAGHRRRPEWRNLWVDVMSLLADGIGRARGVDLMVGFPGVRALRQAVARCGYDAVPPQEVTVLSRAVGRSSTLSRRLAFRAELAGEREPRLDALWSKAAPRFTATFVHDAAHAERRLSGRPGVDYHRFLILPRLSRRPAAFVAFRVSPEALYWVDLVWDGRSSGALELAAHLSALLAAQSGASCEEMWLTGDPEAQAVLARLGFTAAPEPRGIAMILRALNPGLDVESLDGRFHLTTADADLM